MDIVLEAFIQEMGPPHHLFLDVAIGSTCQVLVEGNQDDALNKVSWAHSCPELCGVQNYILQDPLQAWTSDAAHHTIFKQLQLEHHPCTPSSSILSTLFHAKFSLEKQLKSDR
jgi:hypothetical protein